MAGLAHIGIGFGSKRVLPKISIWVILLASELIEILWILFSILGLDTMKSSPWSHSFLMAAVWSVLFGILAWVYYRNSRNGIILGLIVFSHWILDFITHPMGAVMGAPNQAADLPLFFGNSPKVGLGLYNHSMVFSLAVDIGVTILGIAVYLLTIRNPKSAVPVKISK